MKVRARLSILAAFVTVGCSDRSGPPEETGRGVQAILNGTPVDIDTVGTPKVTNSLQTGALATCSGILVNPSWVLTADHCVTAIVPGQVSAQIQNGLAFPAVQIVENVNVDVGLVQTNHPLLSIGGTAFPPNRLYKGSGANLLSLTLPFQGFGANTAISCSGGLDAAGLGEGTLRSGSVKLSGLSGATYTIQQNSNGQIPFIGDFGSALLTTVLGHNRPAAVNTFLNCVSKPAKIGDGSATASDAIRGWVEGVTGHAAAYNATALGYERSDGFNAVIYQTSSHVFAELSATNAGWSRGTLAAPVGGATPMGTAAYVRSDGVNAVVFNGSDQHIHETALVGGAWSDADITAIFGTPLASQGISAYVQVDATNAIVYQGTDSHVHQLGLGLGATSWVDTDLTAKSGGPNAAAAPVGYVRADGTNAVVYVDLHGHIQELSISAGKWVATDLTTLKNAPAVNGSLHPYSRSDGYSAVVFRNNQQQIMELARSPSGTWSLANLTVFSNGPLAGGEASPYVRADAVNAVVFVSAATNHVYELSLDLTTGLWNPKDLTLSAGTDSAVAGDTPNGYVSSDNVSNVVFIDGTNQHRMTLVPATGGNWQAVDMTQSAGGTI